jgi:hypothetical protein
MAFMPEGVHLQRVKIFKEIENILTHLEACSFKVLIVVRDL